MTDSLSPAVQAVWDAWNDAYEAQGPLEDMGQPLGAALRAAAAQIEPTQEDRAEEPKIHSQVFFNGVAWSTVQLLAIADELEAGND